MPKPRVDLTRYHGVLARGGRPLNNRWRRLVTPAKRGIESIFSNDAGSGCDALAIPHNSNISNGRMFSVDYAGASGAAAQAERARLRMKIEPVIEIMQHKGDSECRNGLTGVLGGEDELCDFEKFENLAFTAITGEPQVGDCYDGHLGWGDGTAARRVQYSTEIPGNASNSPGGLIGVWSQQNTRADLFDNIRQKEVFGTSGPRIVPRFFGGWDYPADLCNDPELVTKAYADGVAMGGDLPVPTGEAPMFVASAIGDPGTAELPGVPLQRLQVIKGWYDERGDHHQRVFDVAGDVNSTASVNPQTCEPQGSGYEQLCAVWQDPEFDGRQSAVYYLRVVENPSCRYTGWQCLSLPADQRPADCDNPQVPKTLQERAWSSPIWYTPIQA